MLRFLSNVIGFLWFFFMYDLMILFCGIGLVKIIGNIASMVESGFVSNPAEGFIVLGVFTIFYAMTEWVPSFRKCYKKMPWLYAFCTFLLTNIFIFAITEWILTKGLGTLNTTRYVIALVLAILQIFLCKYWIGKYFWNHKTDLRKFEEYD